MKLVNFILLAFLFSSQILTAETEEVKVTTGENYQNTVWYSLKTGVVKEASKDNWDMAFQTGQNGAIHLNCQKGYELFEIVDSDGFSWDEPIDITDFRESDNFVQWVNSEETWNIGAFNLGKDGFADDGDFGWGEYDMSDHGIKGKKVFLLIMPDGSAKKIMIFKLLNRKYEFKYADLDGSNEVYASVNKNDRANVSFIYFDFATNSILTEAREPDNTLWDLAFGKYTMKYIMPDDEFMFYPVSGIKQNQNVLAVQLDDVNVETVETPTEDQLDANITIIGSDWKTYDLNSGLYNLTENRAYFVKGLEGVIYKIVFTDFSGPDEGIYTFNQTRIETSVNENMPNVTLGVYPNVIESNQDFSVVLADEIPGEYTLSIYDVNGNNILTNVIESDYLTKHTISGLDLSTGIYFIHLANQNGVLTQKIIVR